MWLFTSSLSRAQPLEQRIELVDRQGESGACNRRAKEGSIELALALPSAHILLHHTRELRQINVARSINGGAMRAAGFGQFRDDGPVQVAQDGAGHYVAIAGHREAGNAAGIFPLVQELPLASNT